MDRLTRMLLLSWIFAALTGCTLSIGGPEVAALPEFSGPPVVRIAAPLPNTTYLVGVPINVQVQVTNAGPDIDRVEVSTTDGPVATLPQPNPTGAVAFGVTQTFTPEDEGTYVIQAVAFRADGTASAMASASINVIADLPSRAAPATDTPAATPTDTVAATATMAAPATSTPGSIATSVTQQATVALSINPTGAATANPTAAGPSGTPPVAKFEGVVNVRRGPSTNFEPPLGTFQAGQQTDVLAVNNEGTWYKVRFAGGEGWVFADITNTEGDVASLPRESGPPIPTARPATATPVPQVVPPTTAPSQPDVPGEPTAAVSGDGPNLVVVNWEMRVIGEERPANDIAANKPAIAFVRVRNAGNQSSDGFFAVLTIVNGADSGAKIVEAGPSGGLGPGAEQVIQIGFTENVAPAGTGRVAVVRLDENNQVPETNENDNASSPISYTLAAN